jgi:hypothetical protein
MIHYFSRLSWGKTILWCYLIWYAATVIYHFDPAPSIWLNSLGVSAVIGIALILSVTTNAEIAQADRWQTFRLFLMPFCVSSFSALIKGQGFVLIFPPTLAEASVPLGACASFVAFVAVMKRSIRGGQGVAN